MNNILQNQPLEQVRNLVKAAIRSTQKVNASFSSFFQETMTGVLTITGRINFLQLSRYTKSCEQRFRQNFRKTFNWAKFNLNFLPEQPQGHRVIAIDQSYISKSGKHTPGLGYFWSGCAQKALFGLEILGIAAVDTSTHNVTAITAVQTLPNSTRLGRRPKCIKHIEKESLITHYLRALYDNKKVLHEVSNIVVADAYFSKSTFVKGLDELDFELVSCFRADVALRYLSTAPKTGERGRPKMYDGPVDLNALRADVFAKETLQWDEAQKVVVQSAVVNAKSLERTVKVVIVDFDDPNKKSKTRKIFFSTDCSLSAKDVIDIYRSRFQIEFLFRDAKQYMGLCHCQARDTKALNFAFNLSFSAINVARAYCRQQNASLSIADVKLLMHNAMLIERFLSLFGNLPNRLINQSQKEHYFKELLLYGLKGAV